jgi:N-carbamoylputrescine amidase
MRITVCEMNDDPIAFADDWRRLAQHCPEQDTELVLLPEMPFARWFAVSAQYDANTWTDAVRAHDAWLQRLGELRVPVVVGSRPVTRQGVRLNEGFVWTPEEGYSPVHDKRFLPDEEGYWEARWYSPGDSTFSIARAGRVAIGMLICTEMWSLGHAQRYGKAGAQLLVTPRATGRLTVEKWIVGGRAAAIVSGAFGLSSNRSARDSGGDFGGGGWIVDPDGRVLARTSADEPFKTLDLDLGLADSAKRTYPRYALE